jgi:predicted glycosyltransferase
MPPDHGPARVAVYTHDNYGVGHVRRCLRLARALAEQAPHAAILLITGSPVVEALKELPPNADYVKLPTVAKADTEGPHLPIGRAELSLLREQMIRQILREFDPDVVLVDNFPLGPQRELLPGLHDLRRLRVPIVLGLRDVIDAPAKVQADWRRHGIYEVLDRYYDRMLVYGMCEVLDIVETYGFPENLAEKTRYCGYIGPELCELRPAIEVRAELGIDGPFVLVSVGGGADGLPLLEAFVRALPLIIDISAVVVSGPLMGVADRARLKALADACPRLVQREYVDDLPSYMAAADAVVTMCGYNTATEIVALGCSAVVVPRTWPSGEHSSRMHLETESEQLLRARGLAKLGLVELIEPLALTAERLAEHVRAALSRPRQTPNGVIDLHGAERAAAQVLDLAGAAKDTWHA